MATFRIRKGYKGITRPYIICDGDGYPLYDVSDQKSLSREMKSIFAFHNTLIDERDQLPNLDKIPGKSIYEQVYYCYKRAENAVRLPQSFGYAKTNTEKKQLINAGIDENQIYTENTNPGSIDHLRAILKKGDTLTITGLDQIAQTLPYGVELINELVQREVKIHILDIGTIDSSDIGKTILTTLQATSKFQAINDAPTFKTTPRLTTSKHKGGRPSTIPKDKLNYALELLKTESYKTVVAKTGISKSTLQRAKKQQIQPPTEP